MLLLWGPPVVVPEEVLGVLPLHTVSCREESGLPPAGGTHSSSTWLLFAAHKNGKEILLQVQMPTAFVPRAGFGLWQAQSR